MKKKKGTKKLFVLTLEYESGRTQQVKITAGSREVAERRALKFHPTAKGVVRNG